MVDPISIGTNTVPNILTDKLKKELIFLQKEGLPLDIVMDSIGEFTFLDCLVSDKKGKGRENLETIKSYIANCLAEVIVDEWEARIIRKVIRHNYYYYNEDEKQHILSKAKEILNPVGFGSYQRLQRKEKVMQKILEYLNLHKELILEGFINFRLKDYQEELEQIVNSAVDEFLLEKEYLEFIRLLKYFVDIQEPKIKQTKIIFRSNGKFELLDSENQPVQHECLQGLLLDLKENEINYDDLLISALITLAPEEVELHIEEGVTTGDTIKTIENVFGKRVTKCEGCDICRPNKNN